ncbi:class I SAM-dependent methyltransferase [Metabacillus malikii]|uniref:Ubiquinone/menaquinone biosynthesis C-methylase UbiE n=1 Tax=Metabacillus malikii TaxID=1504265 RepID=A0ABT9Z9I3_9BACI|nr:class I SAM-dependent methyltransferase [Metabacillus malikii]MDQ0228902.1 ubiquinone/menaquinone biosynthesis C-methylase UbiE [Metabacillus malikii]
MNNPKMIEHAKKRNLESNMKISYYIEDLASTSFSENSFDIVLSESVLQFTTISHTLPEIFRILKNNGMLIAIEMVQQSPLTDEEQHELTTFYGMKNIPTIERWKELFSHYHLPVKKISTSTTIELIDNGDPTTEFSPISVIPQETFELLTHHEELTVKYANKVSYCVFYAIKRAK